MPAKLAYMNKGGLIMYYCNGFVFDSYEAARSYADILLGISGTYKAIFTSAEVEAHNLEGITL
jgi:hypothetical protein